MKSITIKGGQYVTLTQAAECYEVEVAWVREVYDYGLLGVGELFEEEPAIEAGMLDRLAEIQRLHNQQGVNLPGIAIILDLLGR